MSRGKKLYALILTGHAVIGAHLHPWVTPPEIEDISARNSYPGNLPESLERAKLETLVTAITRTFGERPHIYLAGRYGVGPNTPTILTELGFTIDVSTCVPLDSSEDGGPDYSACSNEPFWLGSGRALLGIPCTGAFIGWAPTRRALHRVATHPSIALLRLPGVLARLRVVDRLALTPEGFTLDELRRLTRALLASGVRSFVFYFHSPSVLPGCTPYVRNEDELTGFQQTCDRFLEFFRRELGGKMATLGEIRAVCEGAS